MERPAIDFDCNPHMRCCLCPCWSSTFVLVHHSRILFFKLLGFHPFWRPFAGRHRTGAQIVFPSREQELDGARIDPAIVRGRHFPQQVDETDRGDGSDQQECRVQIPPRGKTTE